MKSFAPSLHFFGFPLAILMAAGTLHAQNTISTNPGYLFFQMAAGSTTPAQQTIQVTSSPSASVAFAVSSNQTYLGVSQSSGTTPAFVTVTASPNNLIAGVYSATVTISSANAGTVNLPVVIALNSTSGLNSSPATLVFNATGGSTLPAAQSLNITSTGSAVSYSASGNATWLLVSQGGQTPGTLSVGVNPSGLAPGSYGGGVVITPAGGNPLYVPVLLLVSTNAQLVASPGSVTFNYQMGGTNPATQKTIALSNAGSGIAFSATASVTPGFPQWFSVAPTGGTTPATLNVALTAAAASLPAATYQGKVTIISASAANPTQDIPVTLNVSTQPLLDLSTDTLSFAYQVGGAFPADQTVTPNSTGAALPYSLVTSTNNTGNWLTTAFNGVTGTAVTVSVNPSGLPAGNYTGSLSFTAGGAANNPQVVQVNLTVTSNPQLAADPSSLVFNFETGQNTPAAQTVSVTSSAAPLAFTVSSQQTTTSNAVNWLLVGAATSSTTPASFSVSVNPAGMAPGQYTGTITVSTGGTANDVQLPVTLNVSNTALLNVSPLSLAFTATAGSSALVPAQVVTVTTTGEAVQYSTSAGTSTVAGGFFTVGAASGVPSSTAPSTFSVAVTPQILSAGVYKGTITVHPANGNADVAIPVTLTVVQGNLAVSSGTLSFTQAAGGTVPQTQAVTVSSTGVALAYSAFVVPGASWLSVTPNGGTTPGQLSISVNAPATMQAGSYTGTINIASAGAGNSPQAITVNLTVTQAQALVLNPGATMNFAQQFGAPAASSQSISVTSSSGNLPFSVAATVTSPQGGSWLRVNPSSGTATSTATAITVSVNPQGLSPGTYNGNISFTSPNASNSPQTVAVVYTIAATDTVARILPQFAFGGGWYSALYFTNTGTTSVSFPVGFTADDGRPLGVPSAGGSSVTVTLGPRGTAIIEAPNSGSLNQGYASVSLPIGVTGYGVFRQTTDHGDQEAVVPLSGSTAMTNTLIFDDTGSNITAVAVVNPSSVDATLTITVRDLQGAMLGTANVPLGAKTKLTKALRDI